jgi:hypothetical protein
MDILETVRRLELREGVVGAGVVRNVVWDRLHGNTTRAQLADVDVAYFDPSDVSEDRDKALQAELVRQRPDIPWEVTNQAGVHLWFATVFGYPVEPVHSIEDAVATWPETATAVGVRLTSGNQIEVIAPHGLQDLLGMVLRRNPRRVTYEYFLERLRKKRIEEKWPLVRVIYESRQAAGPTS